MLSLIKKARIPAQGDLSMDWLRPYMSPRKYRSGDELFRKGDEAREMFLTVTGSEIKLGNAMPYSGPASA